MLTKEIVIDKIEIRDTSVITVQQATYILEDGVRIAGPFYKRRAFEPGDNVAAENSRVRDVAGLVWTPDVVSAYRQKKQQGIAAEARAL